MGKRSLFWGSAASEERLELARAAMGRQLRREWDEFVARAVARTMVVPGYDALPVETVRPHGVRALEAVLATLEGADYGGYGEALRELSYMRARQGLPPRALFEVVDFTEEMVAELAVRCLDESEWIAAEVVARRICDLGRAVIIGGYQRSHEEARQQVERLASQFSAPVLPALPGVLVLPIVGAISTDRARQIIDALLAGVADHAAHTAILDLTGLTDFDAMLPLHLLRAVSSARLVGARVVLVGVQPAVAVALVREGSELAGVRTHPTLAAALVAASPITAR